MKCKACNRTLAITRHKDDDVIICAHCLAITPVPDIRWKDDGRYHFMAIGIVKDDENADRILLKDFTTSVLDVRKALDAVRDAIMGEPNLRATCGEFEIGIEDIYIVPLEENT